MTEEIYKILVPIDFSHNSRMAVMWAFEFATHIHKKSDIYIFHVMEPISKLSFVGSKVVNKLNKELQRMEKLVLEEMEGLIRKEHDFEHINQLYKRVSSGNPVKEILKMAGNISADMIVLGAHGRGQEKGILIGNVAEKVTRKAPCTVVVVKEKDIEFIMKD